MALQWNPANEVVTGCDLRENDLRKVGRSTRSLAVDARDFGGYLCPLGGVHAAFDGSDAVGRHGSSSWLASLGEKKSRDGLLVTALSVETTLQLAGISASYLLA